MKPLADIMGISALNPFFKIEQWGDDGFSAVLWQRKGNLRVPMTVIASWGEGWEHISAAGKERCPTWGEMSALLDMLRLPDETWMQLHVPATEHVNYKETCLHMWRPTDAEIPRPPQWMV